VRRQDHFANGTTISRRAAGSLEAATMDEQREVQTSYVVMSEQADAASDATAGARQEIAATRERISDTITDIEQRVSDTVASAKAKVDVVGMIRQHPWPALAIGFAAGLALSVTGADRKAARATKEAAKRAPDVAQRGVTEAAHATAAGVAQLASAAADRIKGSPDDGTDVESAAEQEGGLIAKATGALRAKAQELGDEMKRGADELAASAPPRRSAGI
jgi:ElaB/YqjD/DUF883 family membrane-anchored ribosome-binding protein